VKHNLENIAGLEWVDALLTYIGMRSEELEFSAQRFRSQMYYLKFQRQEVRAAQMRGRMNSRTRQNTMRSTNTEALKLRASQFVNENQSFIAYNRSDVELSQN